MKIKELIIAACLYLGTSLAIAAPVVSFTTSGSAGSWLANFSITNNLGGANNIYFFGVQAPTANVTGAPGIWNTANQNSGWSSNPSHIVYMDTWCCTFGGILPGQTVDGFTALYNTVAAPTSVAWFAYAYGGIYNGTDHFASSSNPGFEGIATTVTAVPEPETYAMFMVGLGLLGFTARRRKDTNV